jgi:hypothetical protein
VSGCGEVYHLIQPVQQHRGHADELELG